MRSVTAHGFSLNAEVLHSRWPHARIYHSSPSHTLGSQRPTRDRHLASVCGVNERGRRLGPFSSSCTLTVGHGRVRGSVETTGRRPGCGLPMPSPREGELGPDPGLLSLAPPSRPPPQRPRWGRLGDTGSLAPTSSGAQARVPRPGLCLWPPSGLRRAQPGATPGWTESSPSDFSGPPRVNTRHRRVPTASGGRPSRASTVASGEGRTQLLSSSRQPSPGGPGRACLAGVGGWPARFARVCTHAPAPCTPCTPRTSVTPVTALHEEAAEKVRGTRT